MTTATSHAFDIDAFIERLERVRKRRHLSYRQMEAVTGVHYATLYRILNRENSPSPDTLATLSAWGRVSLNRYITPRKDTT